MATFFAHLILIVGAIGGLAFFAGFVLRLLSNGYDGLEDLYQPLYFGGLGVLALCAALTWFFVRNVEVARFIAGIHMVFTIVGGIMLFIGMLWRIGAGGTMVEERKYNTWTIVVCGGLVLLIASVIMANSGLGDM